MTPRDVSHGYLGNFSDTALFLIVLSLKFSDFCPTYLILEGKEKSHGVTHSCDLVFVDVWYLGNIDFIVFTINIICLL